jgi:hypothetical protein
MATILDKDVVRDTTVKIDGKTLQVTLSDKQEISFNIKGSKTTVKITIDDLYKQLIGEKEVIKQVAETPKEKSIYPMMNIIDFRALNAISNVDLKTKIHIDSVLALLVEKNKKQTY